MKKINIILIGFAALYFAACSGDEETTLPPSAIGSFVTALAITNGDIALADVGATATVSVSATPANADGVGYYEYSSGDTRIFTVNADGVITATGQGSAVLSVVAKNNAKVKATCKVIVAGKTVETITIAPAYKTRTVVLTNAAQTFELGQQLAVAPAEAYNRQLKYTSLDPEVATVNENGRVTAVWAGETKVIAAATDGSGISDTCYLKVNITPITSLTFYATTFSVAGLNLNTKYNQSGNYDLSPADYAKGTGTTSPIRYQPNAVSRSILEYSSSDPEVLAIESTSSNGFRLIPKKGGRATITATATDGSNVTVTTNPINVYGYYPTTGWEIKESSPTGPVADGGDTWGGPIANFFEDGKQVGFYRAGTPEYPAGDTYFVLDFGKSIPFNYLAFSHSWSGSWNNYSRANRQTLYGSNDGTSFTQLGAQLTLNPAYNAFGVLPAVYNYRYLKVVLATSSAAYTGTGSAFSWTQAKAFLVYDFNIGYLAPLVP
jgi:hypothetical protein